MCTWLILTGEVQVNIRLLITVKSEERFKRNILTVRDHHRAALRTRLDRKVISGAIGTGQVKLGVFTLRASSVWCQRINFRNTRESRDQRRSYRTSRADDVTVGV